MSRIKIGFFDSGVGGISVMTSARSVLPSADYYYYADEAHVPYGTKSPEDIIKYADEAVGFLVDCGVDAVVVACNTATSIAIEHLRSKYPLPIIGMEPALKPAAKTHPSENILLCATAVTIAGEKLQQLIESSGVKPTLVPLPGLVTFAEQGQFDSDIVCTYLKDAIGDSKEFAAIVLGCTHFSYFRDSFRALYGKDVDIIDGNHGTVNRLVSVLGNKINEQDFGEGSVKYFVSGAEADKERTNQFNLLANRYKSVLDA